MRGSAWPRVFRCAASALLQVLPLSRSVLLRVNRAPEGESEHRQTPVLSSLLREDAGMAEVVVKNFELDRIPQTMPGTRKHAVEKPVPQLRKRGFDALSHLGQQGLFL